MGAGTWYITRVAPVNVPYSKIPKADASCQFTCDSIPAVTKGPVANNISKRDINYVTAALSEQLSSNDNTQFLLWEG